MSALIALDLQSTGGSFPAGEGDDNSSSSDDSSYEDEEYATDDGSVLSYYSEEDCLSVIQEETDQDIWNELFIRGVRSRHARSIDDDCDDLPPSPPVRTRSQESRRELSQSPSQLPVSVQSGCLGSRLVSKSSPLSNTGLPFPMDDAPPDGGAACDISSDDCSSAPLNDAEEDCRVGGSSGRMERRTASNEGTVFQTSPKGIPMVSIQTGEQIFACQSDDEYTFLSYNTGDDDMSFVSDVGSSHHNRTVLDMQGLDENLEDSDHQRSELSATCGRPPTRRGSATRRGSGFSLDADSLLPIPEDGCAQQEGPDANIFHQPLDYSQAQKKLDLQIAQNQIFTATVLSPNQEEDGPKSYRLRALKLRLRLEHYSGVRRRKSFERSKKMLGRKFGNVKKTPGHSWSLLAPSSCTDSATSAAMTTQEYPPANQEPALLARFRGMTRQESFKYNKMEFQKKFDKEVKPMVFRRRRSLSPVRFPSSFFDQGELVRRMSKSDGQLLFDPKDLLLDDDDDSAEDDNKNKSSSDKKTEALDEGDLLVLDPKFEEKFKQRQDRFGGLRRRNSFQRSRRVLTKKFDRIQARSKEEKECFGGLQRLDSYKQSRVLFQQAVSLVVGEEDESERSGDSSVRTEESNPNLVGKKLRKATTKSKSRSAWSDSLTRSRRHGISKNEFDRAGRRLETSPDLQRARKHLQHAFKTPKHSARE